jgi:hypothetical protein
MAHMLRMIAVLALVFWCGPFAFADGPRPVTVGIHINDINDISLQTDSFTIDFYVWQRWTDKNFDPSKTLEYMNAFQVWDNSVVPLYDAPQVLKDGSYYMATRYRGQFSSKMPLVKYPFDQQSLHIDFEDNVSASNTQVYVPDKIAVTLNPNIKLSGYVIRQPTITIADNTYNTAFGNTDLKTNDTYSRATLTIPVVRPNITFGIKVILPIFLVAACASLVFWVHPSLADGRIGLGITALLTLVALQLTTNDKLPDVDYLMMIDGLFFMSYIFVIACLGQVVRSSWLTHAGNDAAAIVQDRKAFAVLVTLLVLGMAGFMAMTLMGG